MYLFEVVPDLIKRLGIVDGDGLEHVDVGDHPLEDVVEREETQGAITPTDANGIKYLVHILHIAQDVSVAEHDALGKARGT